MHTETEAPTTQKHTFFKTDLDANELESSGMPYERERAITEPNGWGGHSTIGIEKTDVQCFPYKFALYKRRRLGSQSYDGFERYEIIQHPMVDVDHLDKVLGFFDSRDEALVALNRIHSTEPGLMRVFPASTFSESLYIDASHRTQLHNPDDTVHRMRVWIPDKSPFRPDESIKDSKWDYRRPRDSGQTYALPTVEQYIVSLYTPFIATTNLEMVLEHVAKHSSLPVLPSVANELKLQQLPDPFFKTESLFYPGKFLKISGHQATLTRKRNKLAKLRKSITEAYTLPTPVACLIWNKARIALEAAFGFTHLHNEDGSLKHFKTPEFKYNSGKIGLEHARSINSSNRTNLRTLGLILFHKYDSYNPTYLRSYTGSSCILHDPDLLKKLDRPLYQVIARRSPAAKKELVTLLQIMYTEYHHFTHGSGSLPMYLRKAAQYLRCPLNPRTPYTFTPSPFVPRGMSPLVRWDATPRPAHRLANPLRSHDS